MSYSVDMNCPVCGAEIPVGFQAVRWTAGHDGVHVVEIEGVALHRCASKPLLKKDST